MMPNINQAHSALIAQLHIQGENPTVTAQNFQAVTAMLDEIFEQHTMQQNIATVLNLWHGAINPFQLQELGQEMIHIPQTNEQQGQIANLFSDQVAKKTL